MPRKQPAAQPDLSRLVSKAELEILFNAHFSRAIKATKADLGKETQSLETHIQELRTKVFRHSCSHSHQHRCSDQRSQSVPRLSHSRCPSLCSAHVPESI